MPTRPIASTTPSAPSPALGFVLNPAPVPEVIQMQPAALAEFARILRMTSREPTPPDWWVKVAHGEWGGGCVFCGRPLPLDGNPGERDVQPTVVPLVPLAIGGPHLHDAVVLSCGACKATLGNRDWLAWGQAADRKTRKRLRAMRDRIGMTETFNHLAPEPGTVWTKLQVEKLLAARWSQPRFAVQASMSEGGCFIGVKNRTRPPSEFTAIVWANHGKAVDVPDAAPGNRQAAFYFARPRDCLAAIWELVSVNAWVRRSDLRPAADFLPPVEDPAQASWVFVSPNVGDLVRRDYAKPTGWKRYSKEWKAGKVSKGADGNWAVSA